MIKNNIRRITTNSLKKNFSTSTNLLNPRKFILSAKSLSIPITMMTSYYFLNKRFSSKAHLAGNTRKLSIVACQDLQEGEMREVKYGTEQKESILVLRYDGILRAVSNYCPHFGAPMHTGVLIDNMLKCPWHGASFDVKTGATDISPSINDLTVYEILNDETGPYVNLPEKVVHSVQPNFSKRDMNDLRKFVIIGGGPAGLSAAEGLRQNGYTGELTIITSEEHLPYDRSMLSKWIPPEVGKISLRSGDFLKEYDIDVVTNSEVKSVSQRDRNIQLTNGKNVSYDKLLLASGGSPIIPPIPGKENSNVHVLRSFDDLQKINSACKNAKNIVILGGSFIGMESASNLKKSFANANVTVIEKAPTPFFFALGKEVGSALQSLHEEKGIKFLLGSSASEIKPNSVKLDNGNEIDADVVLIGVGVSPNTGFLDRNQIEFQGRNVKTDLYLNTSDENIFAAGDVASVPYFRTGDYLNFGHYVNAQQQGAVASVNMLREGGNRLPYEYVPYFWTRQWDKTMQYTGYGASFDEVFIDGDLSKLTFLAYYLKGNKVVGFASMNKANAANIMYEAFRNDKVPSASAVKSGAANMDTIKASLKKVKVKCMRANCACERKRRLAAEKAQNTKV